MQTLFRRILVPHDFSEPADRALELAADLAATHRGRLSVLHVVEPFHPPPEILAWMRDVEQVDVQLKRLREVVATRVGRRRVPFECRVVIGSPIDAILDASRGADLIVMATLGRTGLPHLLIGSVTERVVRHAEKPVLTVRATVRAAPAARPRTGRARR